MCLLAGSGVQGFGIPQFFSDYRAELRGGWDQEELGCKLVPVTSVIGVAAVGYLVYRTAKAMLGSKKKHHHNKQ